MPVNTLKPPPVSVLRRKDLPNRDTTKAGPAPTYKDSLGHLAAKFKVADLGLEPGAVELTLTGSYEEGGTFSASDTVIVK
jgi:hypothetical protein